MKTTIRSPILYPMSSIDHYKIRSIHMTIQQSASLVQIYRNNLYYRIGTISPPIPLDFKKKCLGF